MIISSIVFFLVACIVLVVSATLTIKALIKIAAYLRLSDFVVGFIIMALATSIPELFVGVTSAMNKVPSLSLGDVIGSNIVDITLVIGLVAILARGIQIKGKIVIRDTYFAVGVAILPILLMLDRYLSRTDGLVLLLAFFLYALRLWRQRKRFKKISNHVARKEFFKSVFLFVVGVVLLVASAKIIVDLGSNLAIEFGVPLILIGVAFLAIGTSLPELVFEVKAVLAKREGMALGDLLGSVVTNSALVLGLVGLIYPITIADFSLFIVAAAFLVVVLVLFTFLLRTKDRLSWKEGIILIMFYIIFIIVELSIRQ
ncbi:sodium:calcium antiporter [Patescibacteria group bacterium]|nr:sodium:calcium antiporter [Patescibacteria group bacterium]